MGGRVLIVDDDRAMCDLVSGALRRREFGVETCNSAQAALDILADRDFDVVVTDLHLHGMSGIDLCKQLATTREDIPVVVITAFGSLETAVAAIRAGAYDFITKPFEMDELALTLERAIQHRELKAEVTRLRRAVRDADQYGDLIGNSAGMKKVYDLIERVASIDTTVLITGESGTGKELVARALHKLGDRRNGPFVAINCAAMPETLLESELFGHTKGAFTDARASRPGLFVQATGGLLFLDEIGEMPMGMQAKLLRAVQERKVRPVGGERELDFDTRIIAATNRDLEHDVEERKFREDLYYRINVVHIHVPPLRNRGSDVLLLTQNFIDRYSAKLGRPVQSLTSAAAERMMAYDWPGNVRELQNCVERAVALAQFSQIGVEDLPEKLRDYRPTRFIGDDDDPSQLLPMDEVERRYVLRVLEAVGGNKTLAAQILGFDRKTLYRKLERYHELENPGAETR